MNIYDKIAIYIIYIYTNQWINGLVDSYKCPMFVHFLHSNCQLTGPMPPPMHLPSTKTRGTVRAPVMPKRMSCTWSNWHSTTMAVILPHLPPKNWHSLWHSLWQSYYRTSSKKRWNNGLTLNNYSIANM